MAQTICLKCRAVLNASNWYPSFKKLRRYLCKSCDREYKRRWEKNNREKCREYCRRYRERHPEKWREIRRKYTQTHRDKVNRWEREYRRRFYIGCGSRYKGHRIRAVGKRPYPNDRACEVCKIIGKRLVYHHWLDDDYSVGLWVCWRCHFIYEWDEKGIIDMCRRKKSELDMA